MNLYLLFKSLHLIAVISWMAGLLYLPRIFVYHAEHYSEKKASEIFKTIQEILIDLNSGIKLNNKVQLKSLLMSLN